MPTVRGWINQSNIWAGYHPALLHRKKETATYNAFYYSYVYEVVNVVVYPGDSDIKVNPPGNYKTI